jgi:hypothetical protein
MVVRHGVCFVDAAFGANSAGWRRWVVAVALVDHAGVLVGATVWAVEAGAASVMSISVVQAFVRVVDGSSAGGRQGGV